MRAQDDGMANGVACMWHAMAGTGADSAPLLCSSQPQLQLAGRSPPASPHPEELSGSHMFVHVQACGMPAGSALPLFTSPHTAGLPACLPACTRACRAVHHAHLAPSLVDPHPPPPPTPPRNPRIPIRHILSAAARAVPLRGRVLQRRHAQPLAAAGRGHRRRRRRLARGPRGAPGPAQEDQRAGDRPQRRRRLGRPGGGGRGEHSKCRGGGGRGARGPRAQQVALMRRGCVCGGGGWPPLGAGRGEGHGNVDAWRRGVALPCRALPF